MKRFFILLTAFLLALSLFGCDEKAEQSNEQSSQAAESSEESNTENTKKLVSKKVIKNGTGKITQTWEYQYDSLGRVNIGKNESEQGVTYEYISYDENGFEAEYTIKNANGEIQAQRQFEYYDNGYVKAMRSLDKNGKVVSENKIDVDFDEQGRMLNVYVDGELSQYYSYDEEGNATERRVGSDAYNVYDKDNNKIEAVDGDYHMTCTYKNGKPLEAIATRSNIPYKTVYEYDGELLLSQTNYENGEITLKYIYEYDNGGDLIKETMQNALGIASSITEYYYDEFPIEG